MTLTKLFFLFFCYQVCDCARILFIVSASSYSHQIVFRSFWKELAKNGHDVVVITADPEEDAPSNLRYISIDGVYKHHTYMVESFRDLAGTSKIGGFLRNFQTRIAETTLETPEVNALLKNETEHFDLVLAEIWTTVLFAFGTRFSCPVIGLVTLDLSNDFYYLYGNVIHPIAFPDMFMGMNQKQMTFLQRLRSTFYVALFRIYSSMEFEAIAKESQLLKKYFGDNVPSVQELDRSLSMIFINNVPTMNHRPLGLNIISIGGDLLHHEPKPLPKELAGFLDESENGFIYVSLGTNIKGNYMDKKLKEAFVGAFAELPYRILWKLDIDLPSIPKNVKIVDWVPQADVLSHPSIKAFVFQGGVHSMEEGIGNKVPFVGIPFMSDQFTNVRKLVSNGFGVGLDKNKITKESLKEAIFEVTRNPKYKLAMSKMLDIIADQPMTGLQKAVWWTEYVLRHKGAPHLRNPVMDLPFYQYFLLDVIAFCVFTTMVVIYVSYKILSTVIRKTEKQTKQKVT